MTLLTTAFAQGTHAARPAAASSNNGFYYYETDTLVLFQSTGAAWTQLAAGAAAAPLTTKGDVLGYSTVPARVPVGADATVLTADSGQALGVKWASASGSGLTLAHGEVLTDQTTSSTTYTDLATVGPTAVVTVGSSGLVLVGWNLQIDSIAGQYCSIKVSGANTVAASDNWCVGGGDVGFQGRTYCFTGLSTGSTTFTMQYRVGTGTQGFQRRSIWAVAF